jgi:hypothetical protein
MESFYQDILKKIEPHKDKVFYHGLKESEILEIEKKIGKKFPFYFQEFLKTFGVRQDFVFGLIENENTFIENFEYLPNEIKKSFILIGDNGGEDFWLLNSENEKDTNIYEWQHWLNGDVVELGYNFETLLNESILKLSDKAIKRETNDLKNWCVQFAITTENEQKIYDTISLSIIEDWKLEQVSPAEVYCYERKVKLGDKIIKFTRQEYSGWDSPVYYFDLKEPANEFGKESLIKEIDTKLRKVFPEYNLIDYGILPLTEEEN